MKLFESNILLYLSFFSYFYLTFASWKSSDSAGTRAWKAVTCSGDCSKLVAAVEGGALWLSSDFGANWNDNDNLNLTQNPWSSVASSQDWSRLIAAAYNDHIWYSTDGGKIWSRAKVFGKTTTKLDWQSVAW